MQEKLVSFVIPVYNHQKELMLSLATLQKQTYRPLEVIIVDDGSDIPLKESDFKEFADIRVQVLREENKGAPAARNTGARKAQGEYIFFCDADVIAKSDMVEKMVQTLHDNPECDFVYCNFYYGKKKMPGHAFNVEKLQRVNYITATAMIRSCVYIPWDETFERFQDWDYWWMMSERGKKGIWIDEYLFKIIPKKGGISTWLPKFFYQSPWKYIPFVHAQVLEYEAAKKNLYKKHHFS